MKIYFALMALICAPVFAQVNIGSGVTLGGTVSALGAPVISSVTPASPQSPTTIEVQFSTGAPATTTLACNTTGSPYTPNAADNGAFAGQRGSPANICRSGALDALLLPDHGKQFFWIDHLQFHVLNQRGGTHHSYCITDLRNPYFSRKRIDSRHFF